MSNSLEFLSSLLVVDEVVQWIGTPHHHQAAVREAGCDCYGLLRGVYGNVTGVLPPLPFPYSTQWHREPETRDRLKAELSKFAEPLPDNNYQPGDILVFRLPSGQAVHAGILISEGWMVHSYQDQAISKVVHGRLSEAWLERYDSAWRYLAVPRETDGTWLRLF